MRTENDKTSPLTELRRKYRRRLGRRPTTTQLRRALAVLLLVAAVVLAWQPPHAAGERNSRLLVAATEIPAGTTLTGDDVTVVQAPDSMRPDGALTSADDAIGRVIASAARRGEPLTDARLVGHDGGQHGQQPGTAAVPVRLADPGVADVLYPGARVDVVTTGTDDEAQQALAVEATVVTVTDSPTSGPTASGGRLVLISASAEDATRVAAESLHQPVTVILR